MRCTICGSIENIEEHHEGVHRSWERLESEHRDRRYYPLIVDPEFLRVLRQERGITQKWVGSQLGVAEATVSAWENKRRVPEVHRQLEWSRLILSLNRSTLPVR